MAIVAHGKLGTVLVWAPLFCSTDGSLCNCFPLNMQLGNRNLVIFTSDSSGYEDSNCFSLMEIKTCLPCQLLNVEIAAGCGIKYLIYSAAL